MIESDAGLERTQRALAHLEAALRGLTSVRAKYHPTTFAVIAEPIVDAIQAHRAEIDQYIGLGTVAPPGPPTASPAEGPLVGA